MALGSTMTMAPRLNLFFHPLRLAFLARDSLHFPAGKSGNIIRGAFGAIFRKLACGCGALCSEHLPECGYGRIFEPASRGIGPSGLADSPRPFVFRAAHLDGRTIRPGEPFHFDVHIFDLMQAAPAYFVLTFAQLAREGLGPGRGRADLVRVDQLGLDGAPRVQIFDGATFLLAQPPEPVELDLSPDPGPVDRVTVRFLTPTELKSGQRPASRPEFPILFGRIRDRVSTLRALYGAGPLEIDFRAMGERAAAVRMTRCELRREVVSRRSSKTGQRHPIGGFVGETEYEGPLAEFLPYLRAARWTGVGRQTVWGKGVIEVG
jgi:hypothetical protein